MSVDDSEINKYINEAFTEQVILNYENQILKIMKLRQENYPSQKNDDEWLQFTNYVCRRRCKSVKTIPEEK